MEMKVTREARYVARAMAAFFSSAKNSLILAQAGAIPNYECSNVFEIEGRRYVVLRSSERLIAVYRIDNAERLKRLRRWPWSLDVNVEDLAGLMDDVDAGKVASDEELTTLCARYDAIIAKNKATKAAARATRSAAA